MRWNSTSKIPGAFIKLSPANNRPVMCLGVIVKQGLRNIAIGRPIHGLPNHVRPHTESCSIPGSVLPGGGPRFTPCLSSRSPFRTIVASLIVVHVLYDSSFLQQRTGCLCLASPTSFGRSITTVALLFVVRQRLWTLLQCLKSSGGRLSCERMFRCCSSSTLDCDRMRSCVGINTSSFDIDFSGVICPTQKGGPEEHNTPRVCTGITLALAPRLLPSTRIQIPWSASTVSTGMNSRHLWPQREFLDPVIGSTRFTMQQHLLSLSATLMDNFVKYFGIPESNWRRYLMCIRPSFKSSLPA